MIIISSLIKSFVLTFIIEYIIIKLIFVKKKVLVPVLLVNMLTNPFVVYIYNIMSFYSFKYKDIVLVFLELLVVLIDTTMTNIQRILFKVKFNNSEDDTGLLFCYKFKL